MNSKSWKRRRRWRKESVEELRRRSLWCRRRRFKKEMAYFSSSPSPLLYTLTHLIPLYSPRLPPLLALWFSSQFSKPSLIFLIFFDNFTAACLYLAALFPGSLSLFSRSQPILSSIYILQKCVVFSVRVCVKVCVYIKLVYSHLSITSCTLRSQGNLSWRDKHDKWLYFLLQTTWCRIELLFLVMFLVSNARIFLIDLCPVYVMFLFCIWRTKAAKIRK